jgi:undecaprenyl pyrophosphate phosphatase UppP
MSDEGKISLLTWIGIIVVCLAVGWIIGHELDNIMILVGFLLIIGGIFAWIKYIQSEQKWLEIAKQIKGDLDKKDDD